MLWSVSEWLLTASSRRLTIFIKLLTRVFLLGLRSGRAANQSAYSNRCTVCRPGPARPRLEIQVPPVKRACGRPDTITTNLDGPTVPAVSLLSIVRTSSTSDVDCLAPRSHSRRKRKRRGRRAVSNCPPDIKAHGPTRRRTRQAAAGGVVLSRLSKLQASAPTEKVRTSSVRCDL